MTMMLLNPDSLKPRPRWSPTRFATSGHFGAAVLVLVSIAGRSVDVAADQPAADQPVEFNRDIRPLLSDNCFYCHGQDGNQRQADLRLDQREAAIDAGSLVPGDAEASELVARIFADDPDARMPPADSNRTLTEDQKQLIRRWVDEGAAYQTHWAFIAPQRSQPPAVEHEAWVRNPIDRFILARLEAAGLGPSPEADPATLIKRLSSDLIGLPPTPEQVAAFVDDPDPDAYERLVDRLLQSRHYGERMALPWLDAARYADSNGFQQDGDTWQWIWRDWVVRALNDDLSFDRFTIWQLAGDLLPDPTTDQLVASGFNRNHLLNGEGGAISEEQRFVILFDRVDTTATNWLGLTLACAQCHDHKYDPLSMRDYYGMLDAFNRVPESGTPQRQSSRVRVAAPFIELPTKENLERIAGWEAEIGRLKPQADALTELALAAWQAGLRASGAPPTEAGLPDAVIQWLTQPEAQRSEDQQRRLAEQLREHFLKKVLPTLRDKMPALTRLERVQAELVAYRGDQIPRPMVMSDQRPRQTHILDRGDYLSPLDGVDFATPAVLPPLPEGAPLNRLGLAQWLVSPQHPLTARVQVNRMWQHFFGAGIVKTPEDFGVQSEYPLHRELLDWLAVEFREQGWSMKKLHRQIVTSATYRQSSRVTPRQRELDPENRYFGRGGRQRMPSMVLRDWALATAGLLDRRIGGAPVYPYQPEAVWESLAITKERDFTYPASSGADLYRRSLYTFWRRTVGPANMFDASNRQACRVRLQTTSTPLHALTTLNDPTWVEAARVLAERSMRQQDESDERLAAAFRRVLCRAPRAAELRRLRQAYERQLAIYNARPEDALRVLQVGESVRDDSLDPAEHAALAMVCLAILNLDEALTKL